MQAGDLSLSTGLQPLGTPMAFYPVYEGNNTQTQAALFRAPVFAVNVTPNETWGWPANGVGCAAAEGCFVVSILRQAWLCGWPPATHLSPCLTCGNILLYPCRPPTTQRDEA